MTLERTFKIGLWLVEPSLQRISRGTEIRRLEPRIIEVLVCLAERPGEVIARQEILDRVWPGVVVNEDALTRAVSDLRSALGDDPNDPAYIETVRGRGYRLISAVEADPSFSSSANIGLDARTVGTGVAVLLLIALAGSALLDFGTDTRMTMLVSAAPFTSFPGYEIDPVQSPDGSRVAYSWTDDFWEEEFDLYVKQRNSDVPLQITSMEGFEGSPAWSPDGTTIAFSNFSEGDAAIYTVPAIGGPVRKLSDTNSWVFGLDWAPDGRSIVFSERGTETDFHLVTLAVGSLERTDLTIPPASGYRDHSPSVSPDGRHVAFVRNDPTGGGDVFVVPATGGAPKRLTHFHARIRGLNWSSDSSEIFFSTYHPGRSRLWRLDHQTQQLAAVPISARHIAAISVRDGSIVFEEMVDEADVYRLELRGDARPAPVSPSTMWDGEPSLSPDGSQLAFASARAGTLDLWIANADGTNPFRLTQMGDVPLSRPRWSPDGSRLAFNASMDGVEQLFVVNVERGGAPTRVFADAVNAVAAGWSADGNWIYFASNRTDAWNIWKVRPDGENMVQVTADGAFSARETSDGRFLIYTKPETDGLYRRALPDGQEQLIDARVKRWARDLWDVRSGRIFFLHFEDNRATVIETSLDGKSAQVLNTLPPHRSYSSVSVSPDGESIYYGEEQTVGSDLLIVQGIE